MFVTTTPGIEGRPVTGYLGIVTAQGVLGVNAFKDVSAGMRNIFGGRARSSERDLDRQRGQRRHRGGPGRVVAGGRDGDGDHGGQRDQPPEHECCALDRAALEGSTTRNAVSGSGSSAITTPISTRFSTSTAIPSPSPQVTES